MSTSPIPLVSRIMEDSPADQPTVEAAEETLAAILMVDRPRWLATAPCREVLQLAEETLATLMADRP